MAWAAAILFGCDIAFLMLFQAINRDFRWRPAAVSSYGIGPTARMFSASVVVGSLAAPLLAALFWVSRAPVYPAAISLYLVAMMVGRIGVGLFPNSPHGSPRTLSGTIHHGATLLAFTAAWMTIAEAEPVLTASAAAPLPGILTLMKHAISLGFIGVVLAMTEPLHRYFGLAERLFLYATALWFLLAALSFTTP